PPTWPHWPSPRTRYCFPRRSSREARTPPVQARGRRLRRLRGALTFSLPNLPMVRRRRSCTAVKEAGHCGVGSNLGDGTVPRDSTVGSQFWIVADQARSAWTTEMTGSLAGKRKLTGLVTIRRCAIGRCRRGLACRDLRPDAKFSNM